MIRVRCNGKETGLVGMYYNADSHEREFVEVHISLANKGVIHAKFHKSNHQLASYVFQVAPQIVTSAKEGKPVDLSEFVATLQAHANICTELKVSVNNSQPLKTDSRYVLLKKDRGFEVCSVVYPIQITVENTNPAIGGISFVVKSLGGKNLTLGAFYKDPNTDEEDREEIEGLFIDSIKGSMDWQGKYEPFVNAKQFMSKEFPHLPLKWGGLRYY